MELVEHAPALCAQAALILGLSGVLKGSCDLQVLGARGLQVPVLRI